MLLYFLANSQDQFVNCNLNFNGEFSFHYDEKTKSLNIKRNENYLPNYWGEHVQWVTAIAGQNGVGKTTVLKSIRKRFLKQYSSEKESILIYRTNKGINIWYDTKLFESTTGFKINDVLYDTKKFTININEEKLELAIYTNDDLIKGKSAYLFDDFGLIYYTNHWEYSKIDREFDQAAKKQDKNYENLSIYKLNFTIEHIVDQ
ncbi:MAG: hypothetical protein UHX00_10355 [Caryophanon sp.]|nr:hypothetical protein [Caryophanon sp.]